MAQRYYYAERNGYGLGTMTTVTRFGVETVRNAGGLLRFQSQEERDAYVKRHAYDDRGNLVCGEMTAAEARKAFGDLRKYFGDDDQY